MFIRKMKSTGVLEMRRFDLYLPFFLLIFFLIGYLYVGFFSRPNLMTALILFWGSVFVTIVETLMFRLIDTARADSWTRSCWTYSCPSRKKRSPPAIRRRSVTDDGCIKTAAILVYPLYLCIIYIMIGKQ